MKKFTINCMIGEQEYPVTVYIGETDNPDNPLYYQERWLRKYKSGVVPAKVIESFSKLANIAKENSVSFEELCMYALNNIKEEENKQE